MADAANSEVEDCAWTCVGVVGVGCGLVKPESGEFVDPKEDEGAIDMVLQGMFPVHEAQYLQAVQGVVRKHVPPDCTNCTAVNHMVDAVIVAMA